MPISLPNTKNNPESHEASLITAIKYEAPTFIKVLSHTAGRAILEPALAKGKETLQILPSPASN